MALILRFRFYLYVFYSYLRACSKYVYSHINWETFGCRTCVIAN